MTLATFVTSTTGMLAQSYALETISQNVANVSTVGYKEIETLFETQMTTYSDSGATSSYFSSGVVDRRMIDVAGVLSATNSIYDLGISGEGFFIVEGNNETLYTRAGDFQATYVAPAGYSAQEITYYQPTTDGGVTTQSVPATYYTNSSGYYVMGWNYDSSTGTYSSNLEPVIISPMEYYPGSATTEMTFKGNINSSSTSTQTLSFPIYDNDYSQKDMYLNWEPQSTENTWLVTVQIEGATVNTEPIEVSFDEFGNLTSPIPSTNIQLTWDDGTTRTVNLDLSNFTQFSQTTSGEVLSQDGSGFGMLTGQSWDDNGVLNATYSNGVTIPVCKVALAQVTVPNNMEAVTGNMFAYTAMAGDLEIVDLQNTVTSTTIEGGMLESSNVALEDELTNMIVAQRAYSSNAQSFTTANEMMEEALGIMG